jgi:AcrR family transcriptional regulator
VTIAVTGRRKPMRADSVHIVRGRQTRARILAAARVRVLAEGFEALRLDDLARDAGVTKAAVIKSVGGKSSILLALGEEDRQMRLALIRKAIPLRTGLRRRLADLVSALLEVDAAGLNVVMAYIGYMWFWSGADHERAQAMMDDTRALLSELIVAASREPPSPALMDRLALRLMSAYVMALRDLKHHRASLPDCVKTVVSHCLD